MLGVGEAALHFAKGWSQAGIRSIAAFSPSGAEAAPGSPVRIRAEEAGIELAQTPRALAERSDVIVALTPGAAALDALRSVRRFLRVEQLYVDASTSSVRSMERAADMLEGRAGFVDAAIMGTVPLNGLKVPIVASGPDAARFQSLMAPCGMNITVVGEKAGAASAMKLVRSVCMKGIAAVLLESLEAAERYGILNAVAADIAASLDERPFGQTMKRYVCGTAVHAERRVHEMKDCLELLQSLGATDRMTRATRSWLEDIRRSGLRERFGGREPEAIGPVMQAIVQRAPGETRKA